MDSARYMTCELKVDTACAGWHKTMRKMFRSINDVTYNIDATTGIVSVTGRINPRTLLKLLEKAGKHAALIKVDSGQTQPPVDENAPMENPEGFMPPMGPGQLPGPGQLSPPPYHYPYSEQGFQHQPSYVYHYHESDTSCSIM